MKSHVIAEIKRCNDSALECVANLEAYGSLHEGAMLGLKDQLAEISIILHQEQESAPELSTVEARTDLTSRECAKLLGAMIGGLLQMAPLEEIRCAVRWLDVEDAYWDLIRAQTKIVLDATRKRG